jgi:hypothetical protein
MSSDDDELIDLTQTTKPDDELSNDADGALSVMGTTTASSSVPARFAKEADSPPSRKRKGGRCMEKELTVGVVTEAPALTQEERAILHDDTTPAPEPSAPSVNRSSTSRRSERATSTRPRGRRLKKTMSRFVVPTALHEVQEISSETPSPITKIPTTSAIDLVFLSDDDDVQFLCEVPKPKPNAPVASSFSSPAFEITRTVTRPVNDMISSRQVDRQNDIPTVISSRQLNNRTDMPSFRDQVDAHSFRDQVDAQFFRGKST